MHLMHLLMESVPTAPTCGSTACLPACLSVRGCAMCVRVRVYVCVCDT